MPAHSAEEAYRQHCAARPLARRTARPAGPPGMVRPGTATFHDQLATSIAQAVFSSHQFSVPPA